MLKAEIEKVYHIARAVAQQEIKAALHELKMKKAPTQAHVTKGPEFKNTKKPETVVDVK